jgi:hypothetical protein
MSQHPSPQIDPEALAPYAGRWVALVRGRVTGVGWTRDEALRAARRNLPKALPELMFVPAAEEPDVPAFSA